MKSFDFGQVKVLVNCQYWENKAYCEGGEAWRPKGGISFSFVIDSDEWMYCDDEVVKPMVERIIASKCNDFCRMDIIDYETIFEEPKDISDEVALLCEAEYKRLRAEA